MPKSTNEDNVDKIIEKKIPSRIVSVHDTNAFMTTRYHMPDSFVDKTNHKENEIDAHLNAIEEENRNEIQEKDNNRANQERLEKARLRGKYALEKQILNDNYNEILNELCQLEKVDREKRQKDLMNIPKEIFLPAWQRQQEKNELQLELERKFEKIYADASKLTIILVFFFK